MLNANSYALMTVISGIILLVLAGELPEFGVELIEKIFGDATAVK